jgi:hypothetical protein
MNFTIDLSLKPTTFDLWHVCLLGTIGLLALTLIIVLVLWIIWLTRVKKPTLMNVAEKIIEAPAPKPVILKEVSADAALQLLGLLQQEARFIDFIKEEINTYTDAEVGIAARVVHEGCHKVINQYFSLEAIRHESEGSRVTLPIGFDAASIRLTGNIVGQAPFTGELVHQGWQVTDSRLPKLTAKHNVKIIVAAEVEL